MTSVKNVPIMFYSGAASRLGSMFVIVDMKRAAAARQCEPTDSRSVAARPGGDVPVSGHSVVNSRWAWGPSFIFGGKDSRGAAENAEGCGPLLRVSSHLHVGRTPIFPLGMGSIVHFFAVGESRLGWPGHA